MAREQTDWLQECDMPHSPSERLCFLFFFTQNSACQRRSWKKVDMEVCQTKKKKKKSLPVDTAPDASSHLYSD